MAVSKLISGFLLGVIVTIAIVFLFDGKPREMQESPAGQPALLEELADVKRSKPTKGIDEANEESGEELDISTSAETVSNAKPLTLQAEAIGALQSDAHSTRPAARLSARTTNDEYPPEITDMIEKSVNKELQARYASDEREESWATYMEGQLAAYFAQKPELAQFNFSLIDCRTSICEIHALGYGPDALTLWNIGTSDIVTQTWHDFGSMSMNRNNPEPDILGIVLILTRKPSD